MPRLSKDEWAQVEREYRLGNMGLRALAEKYSIAHTTISRRATKEGWTRDHTQEVQAVTRAKLANYDAKKSAPKKRTTDAPAPRRTNEPTREDIDAAAGEAVKVVLSHRKETCHLRSLVARQKAVLHKKLHDHRKHIGEPLNLDDLLTVSKITKNLGVTIAKMIPLERQAYQMQEGPGGPEDPNRRSDVKSVHVHFHRHENPAPEQGGPEF